MRRPSPSEDDAFFDDAPCGFVATSADGVIRRVNQTFIAMSGFAEDELTGHRKLSSLLSVGGRIYYETHLSPLLLASGQVRGIALELVAAGGARLPVLVSATLVRDEHGEPDGVRLAIFDATERRAYEEELLAARRRAEESEARSRALVHSLQRTLVPPVVPTVEGLEVAAASRAAGDGEEVGGDFYDVFPIGADDWIVVVGDVTGKGVDAAGVTALARYAIRAAAVVTASPDAILLALNDVLRGDDTTNRWCTVVVARLRRVAEGWTAAVCHAGHPLGLLVGSDGSVSELGRPGTLLGAFERPTLHTSTHRLSHGDAMVLHTDGVTEARSPDGFYGEARVAATLQRHRGSAHGLAYRLLDDVVAFQSGTTADDIVIVALHVPVGEAGRGTAAREGRGAGQARASPPAVDVGHAPSAAEVDGRGCFPAAGAVAGHDVVEGLDVRLDGRRGEVANRLIGETSRVVGGADERSDGCGPGRHVGGVHEQTVVAGGDRVGEPADVRRDDRGARGHGLEGDGAERFGPL